MGVDFHVRFIISLLLNQAIALLASPAIFTADNNNVGIMQAYGQPPSVPSNIGTVSFRTHDLSQINDGAVYDPGDELLRALNAETVINGHELGTSPEEPDYADTVFNGLEVANKFDLLHDLEKNLLDEQDIVTKSNILMKLIKDPTIQTMPVVYVEEAPIAENNIDLLTSDVAKRSRYYRRYPWKRHNRNRKYFTSSSYEPELRYACTPTKEDVFKLLVNLHENRKGNHSKTVNFCNRKRPAKAIFTNIRFLG